MEELVQFDSRSRLDIALDFRAVRFKDVQPAQLGGQDVSILQILAAVPEGAGLQRCDLWRPTEFSSWPKKTPSDRFPLAC